MSETKILLENFTLRACGMQISPLQLEKKEVELAW